MFSTTARTRDGRTVLIREATASDARRVLDYVDAIASESDFLTFGPGEFTMTLEQEIAYLDHAARTDNALFLIAEMEGAMAGALGFAGGERPRNRHAGEFGMSVRKQSWGMGIGAALVDALIEWARDTGIISKINLKVRTDNSRAIALYDSRGFRREGTVSRELLVGGRYHDQYLMGLEL